MSSDPFFTAGFSYILTIIKLFLVVCIVIFLGKLFGPAFQKNHSDYTPLTRSEQQKRILANKDMFSEKVEDGIHLQTGLRYGKGFNTVRNACLSCHSAKLITQNRASRVAWKEMIVWMQATQGLGKLGDREPVILDYLAKYYAPEAEGRRKSLDIENIKWYILNKENIGD